MDDYAKVIHKKTKRLQVIKLMVKDGMNPIVSEVDFVHDGDLNKSLKHYVSSNLKNNNMIRKMPKFKMKNVLHFLYFSV